MTAQHLATRPAVTLDRVPAKAAGRPRLAWLDALRGIAALCVVYEHFGARVLPGVRAVVFSVFDPGLYGVLVFFLISGYIVPASLERRASLRTFWISRLFRLFPLFAVVAGATLLLSLAGLVSLQGMSHNVAAMVLSHLFMLDDLLGGTNLIVVIWTLSYEMVFYLLLSALFTSGLHRRSGVLAVAFAAGALLLGGVLPNGLLSRTFGLTQVALAADVLVIGGLAAAVATRGLTRTLGVWLAAGTGLILVVCNERRFAYEGLTILALMFTGTMLYRARQGQIGHWRAIAVAAGVFAAAMAAGAWHIPAVSPGSQSALQQREWVISVALAGITFTAGLAAQNLRVPRVLAWLGLVSYSVYLLLPLVLDLYDAIPFPRSYQHQDWLQAGVSVVFLAALLGCSALTYYLVEAPMQRLGRRVTARLDARFRLPADAVAARPARDMRSGGSGENHVGGDRHRRAASWRVGNPDRPHQLPRVESAVRGSGRERGRGTADQAPQQAPG
ncbi:MAG TPA: acyltransferase [Streptosporangiaceae bacterium]|jgi:peptidoglycan/LPS O-acetylase OafA/YrhL|nr:acyltransferase [Streptosporangiaceae bacterium]